MTVQQLRRELKREVRRIDRRFEQVDGRFDRLERLIRDQIAWSRRHIDRLDTRIKPIEDLVRHHERVVQEREGRITDLDQRPRP